MSNLRVHGTKILRRRSDVAHENDYHKYKDDLRQDFQCTCGYCGKHEMISHKGMEPDHFVPDRIDPSRKTDYTNLVYSCFTCNRKKLGKWPTEDKLLSHDGAIGFVDPATDEYDDHVGRAANGEIIHLTSVGKYMCDVAFRYDIRPTKEVWQASRLFEMKDELRKRIRDASPEEKEHFIEIEIELAGLSTYLFDSNE